MKIAMMAFCLSLQDRMGTGFMPASTAKGVQPFLLVASVPAKVMRDRRDGLRTGSTAPGGFRSS